MSSTKMAAILSQPQYVDHLVDTWPTEVALGKDNVASYILQATARNTPVPTERRGYQLIIQIFHTDVVKWTKKWPHLIFSIRIRAIKISSDFSHEYKNILRNGYQDFCTATHSVVYVCSDPAEAARFLLPALHVRMVDYQSFEDKIAQFCLRHF